MTSRLYPPANPLKTHTHNNIPSPPSSPAPPSPQLRQFSSRDRLSKVPTPTRQRSSQSLRSSDNSSRSSSSLSNYRSDSALKSRIPVPAAPSSTGSRQPSPTKRASYTSMAENNPPSRSASGDDDNQGGLQNPRTRPAPLLDASKIPRSTLLGRQQLFNKPKSQRNSSLGLSRKLSSKEETPPRGLSTVFDESAVDEEFSEEDIMDEHAIPTHGAPERIRDLMRRKIREWGDKEHMGVPRRDILELFRACVRENGDLPDDDWEKKVREHLADEDEEYWDYDSLLKLYSKYVYNRELLDADRRIYSPTTQYNQYDDEEREFYAKGRNSRRSSNDLATRRFSNDSPFRSSSRQGYASQAARYEELSLKFEKVQRDLDDKTSAYEALYEELQSQREKLAKDETEHEHQNENLAKKNRELERKIRGLEGTLSDAEKAYQDLISLNDEHLKEKDAVIAEKERALQTHKEHIKTLEKTADETKNRLEQAAEYYGIVKDLRVQLETDAQTVQALQESFKAEKARAEALEREVKDVKAERKEAVKMADRYQKEVVTLEKRLAALAAEEDPKKVAALPAMGTGIDKTVTTTKEAIQLLIDRQGDLEEGIEGGYNMQLEDVEEQRAMLEELKNVIWRKGKMLEVLEGEKFVVEMRYQDAIKALKEFQAEMESKHDLTEEENRVLLRQKQEMEEVLEGSFSALKDVQREKEDAERRASEAIEQLKREQREFQYKEQELTASHAEKLLAQRQQLQEVIDAMTANLAAASYIETPPAPTVPIKEFPSLLPSPAEHPNLLAYLLSPFTFWTHQLKLGLPILRTNPPLALQQSLSLLYVLLTLSFTLISVFYAYVCYREAMAWGSQNGVFVRERLMGMRCLSPYAGYYAGGVRGRVWEGRVWEDWRYWAEGKLGVPRLMPS